MPCSYRPTLIRCATLFSSVEDTLGVRLDPTWAVIQAAPFADASVEARRLIRREVRSDRVEQRDRGAYGLLVSQTALARPAPKQWSLSFAMRDLYQAFETESQKPGKAFYELVRRRRRELGLPVASEERVLPFRSQPSPSLPAIDLVIDYDAGDNSSAGDRLALLRTERRLEEIDIALDRMDFRRASRTRASELQHAYECELRVLEQLDQKLNMPD